MSYYPDALDIVANEKVNHKAVLLRIAKLSPKTLVKAFELMSPEKKFVQCEACECTEELPQK